MFISTLILPNKKYPADLFLTKPFIIHAKHEEEGVLFNVYPDPEKNYMHDICKQDPMPMLRDLNEKLMQYFFSITMELPNYYNIIDSGYLRLARYAAPIIITNVVFEMEGNKRYTTYSDAYTEIAVKIPRKAKFIETHIGNIYMFEDDSPDGRYAFLLPPATTESRFITAYILKKFTETKDYIDFQNVLHKTGVME